MTCRPFRLALFALCVVGLMPVAAQAQWYDARPAQPAPLYPYQLQPGQSYAVEVAPGRYVIHRPAARAYSYMETAPRYRVYRRHYVRRPVVRRERNRIVINTRRIVREKPVVIVHRRVVDDPTRVIVRRHYVEDAPPSRRARRAPSRMREDKRVIHAEAEITILGPDRMSIRLYRKRGNGGNAFGKQ